MQHQVTAYLKIKTQLNQGAQGRTRLSQPVIRNILRVDMSPEREKQL